MATEQDGVFGQSVSAKGLVRAKDVEAAMNLLSPLRTRTWN